VYVESNTSPCAEAARHSVIGGCQKAGAAGRLTGDVDKCQPQPDPQPPFDNADLRRAVALSLDLKPLSIFSNGYRIEDVWLDK
jgi:hypothetical protein